MKWYLHFLSFLGILVALHFVCSEPGYCQKDGVNCEDEGNPYKPPQAQDIIETKVGKIKGSTIKLMGKEVNEYAGIPFAEPPLNELRFKNPVSVKPWPGILNANRYKAACAQNIPGIEMSEDCLYLNVWSPAKPRSMSSLMPVLFWIHGGSFMQGSGSEDSFNGTALAAFGDVIVVTFNYRLGFFGFLYSEADSDEAPGNMGLRDQILALKWVKSNIIAFGGDGDKVTVFGESAGGISVGILTLSPESRQLFSRAIIESGSPYSFLRPDNRSVASKKALRLSHTLGCSPAQDEPLAAEAIACLRSLSEKDILAYSAQERMHSLVLPNPMYGTPFLEFNAYESLRRRQVTDGIQVLLGINDDEGSLFLTIHYPELFDPSSPRKISKHEAEECLRALLLNRVDDPSPVLAYYFGDIQNENSDELREALFRAYGDLYIDCPVYFLGRGYATASSNSRVYNYLLKYKAKTPMYANCKGICHAEELVFVFGLPLRYAGNANMYSSKDRQFSLKLIQLWTDFARTGALDSNWEPVDAKATVYTELNPERPIKGTKRFKNCDDFWKPIFESKMKALD